MPRCNSSWVRKGDTQVKVTVPEPPKKQVLILKVAFFPRLPELAVLDSLSFGTGEIRKGAEWTTPANYRAVFTLITTGNDALETKLLIGGKQPSCPPSAHCFGACKPSGQAGVAGSWSLVTFGGAP